MLLCVSLAEASSMSVSEILDSMKAENVAEAPAPPAPKTKTTKIAKPAPPKKLSSAEAWRMLGYSEEKIAALEAERLAKDFAPALERAKLSNDEALTTSNAELGRMLGYSQEVIAELEAIDLAEAEAIDLAEAEAKSLPVVKNAAAGLKAAGMTNKEIKRLLADRGFSDEQIATLDEGIFSPPNLKVAKTTSAPTTTKTNWLKLVFLGLAAFVLTGGKVGHALGKKAGYALGKTEAKKSQMKRLNAAYQTAMQAFDKRK